MTPLLEPPVTPALEPLTLRAAADLAGVSVSTIRRRKSALIEAGATVEPSGWAIPIAALKAVFVLPPERAHDTPLETPSDTPVETPLGEELVKQLRSENAFLRQQVEQQARTIERQAEAHAVISAQLTKLGQLESGTVTPDPVNGEQPASRRRWWKPWA